MRRPKHQMTSGEDLLVGIDLHKHRWHVTIRTFDVELFSANIPGTWEALQRVLARYPGHSLQAVYEAKYFGFWLHDRLVDHGVPCMVTPPSLVPKEYGNRVKTDRRDSSKLAHLLAKGLLKRVWVPKPQTGIRFCQLESVCLFVQQHPSHAQQKGAGNGHNGPLAS